MTMGLFLNGVFEDTLQEILNAQSANSELICFLQPYSKKPIAKLSPENPSIEQPVQLYISTTTNLGLVSYAARIVKWESKRGMSEERLLEASRIIAINQPNEGSVYREARGIECANLLSIMSLQKLAHPLCVGNLIKLSNGTPVKPRSTAGGWAYVSPLPDWPDADKIIREEQLEAEFNRAVANSMHDSSAERQKRLANAEQIPPRIQVLSYAYRRNPDVVAEVLSRAQGKCEICKADAPFLRASDNSPFLEIHHTLPLADGGKDAVENAQAVCPNCHRKMHLGVKEN
jgi:5-methylcytosine-specific restriction enzyme A